MESDEQLIRRVAGRDEAALVQLHRRYAPYLLAMAKKMLDDADECQQSVEDAFVKAWEAAARFDPARASAKTWLVTLAHRLMMNRGRGGRLETLPLEAWDVLGPSPDHLGHVRLREAVERLSVGERELVELAFYRGYSHQELAEIAGHSLGAVKADLRVVLSKLKESLEGEKDED